MRKEVAISSLVVIFLVAALLLLMPDARAVLSCSFSQSCPGASPTVTVPFGELFDVTNTHFENNTGTYLGSGGYGLCCNSSAANITTNCTAPRGATILRVYDNTNSHVEINTQTNYDNRMCITSPTAFYNCTARTSDCTARETCMGSLHDVTNSHMGSCNQYEYNVCCRDDDMDHDEYSDYDQGSGGVVDDYDDCDDTDPMNNPRRIAYYCPKCGSKQLTFASDSRADESEVYARDCYFEDSSIISTLINSSTVISANVTSVIAIDSYIENSIITSSNVSFSVVKDTVFACSGLSIEGVVDSGVLTSGRIWYNGVAYDAPFTVADICSQAEPFPGVFSVAPTAVKNGSRVVLSFDGSGKTNLNVTADLTSISTSPPTTVLLEDAGEYPDSISGDSIYTANALVNMSGDFVTQVVTTVEDNIGNSQLFNATITIDNTPPNATIILNSGDVGTQEALVEASLTFVDETGISECRLSTANLARLVQECRFETLHNTSSTSQYVCRNHNMFTQNTARTSEGFTNYGVVMGESSELRGTSLTNYDNGAGTVELSFKPTWSGSDGQEYIFFANPTTFTNTATFTNGLVMYKSTGDQLVFSWADGSGVSSISAASTAITAGTWHHLAFTWTNGTSGSQSATLYLDGTLIASSNSLSNYPASFNATYNLGMGGYNSLNATVDNFRKWDYAKDANQLSSDANAPAIYEPGSCTANQQITLLQPNGNKYVYFEVKDTATNTRVVNDSIFLGLEDATPPVNLTVTDDGVFTKESATLHATLSAFDPESPVIKYQYRIYDATDATYDTAWVWTGNDGTDDEIFANGLTLEHNHTYHFEVGAYNVANVSGDFVMSDGITVDLFDPPTPFVNATTHVSGVSDADQSPVMVWNASDNVSGVYGYSYLLSTTSGNTPDAVAETYGKLEFVIENTTISEAHHADIGVSDNGDYLAVWVYNDSTDSDIYAQRYDIFGDALGKSFKVNSVDGSEQTRPAVAGLSSGQFVLVWESPDAAGSGIRAVIVDADNTLGTEFAVNDYTLSEQRAPAVAAYDSGFIITWHSDAQDTDGNGIYAKRYTNTGTEVAPPSTEVGTGVGNEFQVSTTTANAQEYPTTAYFDDGTYVIVWENDVAGVDPDDVYYKVYNSTGHTTFGEVSAHSAQATSQRSPSVSASSKAGVFAIAYETDGQDGGGYGVYAREFLANGTAATTEFGVNTYTTGDQRDPKISFGIGKGFVVAWSDEARNSVHTQSYVYPSVAVGGEVVLDTSSQNVSLAFGTDVTYLVAWHDTVGTAGSGTYARMEPAHYREFDSLADNTYYFSVLAIDHAGNDGTASEFTLIIDANAPNTPVFSHGDVASNSGTIQFNWTHDTSGSTISEYEFRYDTSSDFSSPVYVTTGSTNLYGSINFGAAEQTYYVAVRAISSTGAHSAWSSSVSATVDSSNPSITPLAPTSGDTITSALPTYKFSSDENCIAYYSLDAWATANVFDFTSSTYHETRQTVSLADATYTLRYRCIDAAGNIGTSSFSVDVDTAVDIGFVTIGASSTTYAGTLTNISVTVQDSSFNLLGGIPYERFTLYIEGAPVDTNVEDEGNGTYQLLFVAPLSAGLYDTYVTVDETDSNTLELDVSAVRLVIGFGDGSATYSRDRMVYESDAASGVFGIATDSSTDEANVQSTTGHISTRVGDNAFIFMSRPEAQLGTVDEYLEDQNLLDQMMPTFGYEINPDLYDIMTALSYSDVVVEGDVNIPAGRYDLVIINTGKVSEGSDAGKDRLLIRIE